MNIDTARMHPFTLRFADAGLEQAFQDEQARKARKWFRAAALGSAGVILIIWLLLDQLMPQIADVKTRLLIPMLVMLAIMAYGYVRSYTPSFVRIHQGANLSGMFVLAAVIVWMISLLPRSLLDAVIVMVVIHTLNVYGIARLRFPLACYGGWGAAAMYLGYLSYMRMLEGSQLVAHASVLIITNLFGMIAGYLADQSARREFIALRDQQLAESELRRAHDQVQAQARELADWNRTLEQRVADGVRQIEQMGRLKRFLSPQIADLIVGGTTDDPLKSHRREITVVFLDLRGFTAFIETADPEEVMGVLHEYHGEMGRLIIEHNGTIEHFAGDGIMIFFNDPVAVENPAEQAVRMAIRMQAAFGGLSQGWKKRGYDLHMGIGIAQGYATLGMIGFEGRRDYGAIGPVTNLASRLCGDAKAGQILVAQKVFGFVEDLVTAEPVGELNVKGFHKPVPAFNVTRLK